MHKLTQGRVPNAFRDIVYYERDSWMWGKACKKGKHYAALQSIVKCKDYIVDCFYRHPLPTTPKKEVWWLSNCFYVFIPPHCLELFQQNIFGFLATYMETHGYTPTIITQVAASKTDLTCYVVEGDDKWMQNTYTLSHYLSLLRMCGYYTSLSLNGPGNAYLLRGCNETTYLRGLKNKAEATYLHIWQNPSFLHMDAPTGDHPRSLYINNGADHKGHGCAGYFYLLGQEKMPMYPHVKRALELCEKQNPMIYKIREFVRNVEV